MEGNQMELELATVREIFDELEKRAIVSPIVGYSPDAGLFVSDTLTLIEEVKAMNGLRWDINRRMANGEVLGDDE